MVDPNIVRWLVASCRAYFKSRQGIYPLFFENTGPKNLIDSNGQPINSYGEFRIEGPYIRYVTTNETWYEVELNILCHTGINAANSDEIERMVGLYAAAFANSIPVMKFGNSEGDDRTVQVGCLILLDNKGEQVRVSRFGQANPDTKLSQASIDGTYRMRTVL